MKFKIEFKKITFIKTYGMYLVCIPQGSKYILKIDAQITSFSLIKIEEIIKKNIEEKYHVELIKIKYLGETYNFKETEEMNINYVEMLAMRRNASFELEPFLVFSFECSDDFLFVKEMKYSSENLIRKVAYQLVYPKSYKSCYIRAGWGLSTDWKIDYPCEDGSVNIYRYPNYGVYYIIDKKGDKHIIGNLLLFNYKWIVDDEWVYLEDQPHRYDLNRNMNNYII